MLSRTYLLQNDQAMEVTVTWEDNWQNVAVYYNNELIEAVGSAEQLRPGKAYLLSAEQVLELKLKGKKRPKLEVLLDGLPVEAQTRSTHAEGRQAVTPRVLERAGTVLLSFLGGLGIIWVLAGLGFGWGSMLLGSALAGWGVVTAFGRCTQAK